MKSIVFIFAFFYCVGVNAQLTPELNRQIDSLKIALNNANSDSSRINCLFGWDDLIYAFDDILDFDLNSRIEKICDLNLKRKLNKKEKIFFSMAKAKSLNNLGNIYDNRGDIAKSIKSYTQSLKIDEGIGNKLGMATALNNIGNIYSDQSDTSKALYYYKKSMGLREEAGDFNGLAMTLNNISSIYHMMGNNQRAIEYSTRSLKIREQTGNKKGASVSLNNIGSIYSSQGDHQKALVYYEKSLELKKEVGDMLGMAICYLNIGDTYDRMGDLKQAITYYSKAREIAREHHILLTALEASKALYLAYKNSGDYAKALEMHESFIFMKDSLDRVEGKKELVRQEFKYEYEKKAAADSVRALTEKKLTNAKLSEEQILRNILYVFLFLTLVFSIFMFNRFKVTSKQKGIIEDQKQIVEAQKELVEAKQREVMDSIHYAKRIQEALLPSVKSIGRNLSRLGKKTG